MMRKRGIIPLVQGLEARSMLSGITYSLTTDQATYRVGQPIQFTFTETNTGTAPATVSVLPADFSVSDGYRVIWQSDPGASQANPTSEVLQPGQSITQTATWDGTTPYTVPGSSSPTYSLDQWGSFQASNLNAPSGTSAAFQITDPISEQLTTDRSTYQLGQTINVTYTETNTSNQTLTFLDDGGPKEWAFFKDGQMVMAPFYPAVIRANPSTLAPGQVVTWTVPWDGIPSFGPYDLAHLTGTFEAAFQSGVHPTAPTATFQIVGPTSADIVSTVTTDHSSYTLGQPVQLAFTETNEGTQTVPIIVGGPNFQIATGNGTPVWDSSDSLSGLIWSQLAPGQSYTRNDTWDGTWDNGSQQGGAYVVTNLLDPNQSSASFTITNGPLGSHPPSGTTGVGAPTSPPPSGTTGVGAPTSGASDQVTAQGSAPSPIAATVSTNRPAYRINQKVRIALEIQASSHIASALPPLGRRVSITISEGSKVIWKASRRVGKARRIAKLAAGHPIRLNPLWDGRPNQPGAGGLRPGTYEVSIADGPIVGSSDFTVLARRS